LSNLGPKIVIMASDRSQKAGVVGAGIAGLCAAIALRRAGWQVDVFEKSQFKNEIGSAISMPPNATCVLDRWGFDFDKAGPVANQKIRLASASELESFYLSEYPDIEKEYGSASWSFHRVDLHRGLRDLATSTEGNQQPPATLKLGCDVHSIDCERGMIKLKNGEEIQKDLLVIADGAHVSARDRFSWSR
jgi:salicylate hydroxylase